jgi:hypothetical protein
VPHEVVPYFYSVLGNWGELESVGPAYKWDTEILRGSYAEGAFTSWYLQDGAVKGAMTWGRPDDLDAARRLIVARAVLDEPQQSALADLGSDLGSVGR